MRLRPALRGPKREDGSVVLFAGQRWKPRCLLLWQLLKRGGARPHQRQQRMNTFTTTLSAWSCKINCMQRNLESLQPTHKYVLRGVELRVHHHETVFCRCERAVSSRTTVARNQGLEKTVRRFFPHARSSQKKTAFFPSCRCISSAHIA